MFKAATTMKDKKRDWMKKISYWQEVSEVGVDQETLNSYGLFYNVYTRGLYISRIATSAKFTTTTATATAAATAKVLGI